MQVVYAQEAPPPGAPNPNGTIFLAGPSPRLASTPSWRPEALRLLAEQGFAGDVYVPEPRAGKWPEVYEEDFYIAQVEWEDKYLESATCIMFWVPRRAPDMLGLTTNDEWGTYKRSGRVVFGSPPDAVSTRYQRHHATKLRVPLADTLADTVSAAIARTAIQVNLLRVPTPTAREVELQVRVLGLIEVIDDALVTLRQATRCLDGEGAIDRLIREAIDPLSAAVNPETT